MKNILVPTDFSTCANHATRAAFDIAKYYNAKVHLFANLETNKQQQNIENTPIQPSTQSATVQKTEALLHHWEERALEEGIAFSTAWASGNLVQYIKDYTDAYQIDFIIMGSHGASGKNEYFIGANTQRVVRLVHCPVMIVKNEINSRTLRKVAFASNFSPKEKVAFRYLLDFIRPFQPDVHLMHINTASWSIEPYPVVSAAMENFKEMCGNLKCYMHHYRDWTADAGIRHLARDIGADLIAISNYKRSPLKRMFSGSHVEALVNHTEVPVLSIDFPVQKVQTHDAV